MWFIISILLVLLIILCIIGALLGGESFGECLRYGTFFVIVVCVGFYFYGRTSAHSKIDDPITHCARCGGDGELSEAEWNDFLMSDILDDENTIKTFQDWMDLHHPGWVRGENIHTSFGFTEVRGNGINNGYGIFGPLSRKAYAKYKRDCFTYNSDSPNTCVLCGN